MTDIWITIAILAAATAAIRAAGPVLLGGRGLPGRLQGAVAMLAPAMLAALVVVQTVGAPEGGEFEPDARIAGMLAAAGVLVAGGSMLPVAAVAAVVTALVRAFV
jgi:branched-subunit amino acid transport protein